MPWGGSYIGNALLSPHTRDKNENRKNGYHGYRRIEGQGDRPCQGKVEMSCFELGAEGAGLQWIRCSGGVALPGADPKTAATGLAPKQTAPDPQSNRAR